MSGGRPVKDSAEGRLPLRTESGVVRLRTLPKAAYLEGWVGVCVEGHSRGDVRLGTLPKAACLEGWCREVVQLGIPPRQLTLEACHRMDAVLRYLLPVRHHFHLRYSRLW